MAQSYPLQADVLEGKPTGRILGPWSKWDNITVWQDGQGVTTFEWDGDNSRYHGISGNLNGHNVYWSDGTYCWVMDSDLNAFTELTNPDDPRGFADTSYGHYGINVELGTYATDYPSEGDVRENVSYNNGNNTGSLVVPSMDDVLGTAGGNYYPPAQQYVKAGEPYGIMGSEIYGTYECEGNEAHPNLVLPEARYVQQGTEYGYEGNGLIGDLIVPMEGDVRSGVNYGDASSRTGTCVLPDSSNVRVGVTYGPDQTFDGQCYVPGTSDVRLGVLTGYDMPGGGTLVLPTDTDVRANVQYGANGLEYTGAFEGWTATFPQPDEVLEGIEFGWDSTDHLIGTLVCSGASEDPSLVNATITIRNGAGTAQKDVVVNYQLLHMDDDSGDGFSDAIMAVTTGEDGVATLPMMRGGVYAYWCGTSIRRTVVIGTSDSDPYPLPSLVV